VVKRSEQRERMGRGKGSTADVARLCDRVAIMGKILAVDSVHELLRQRGGPSTVEAEVAQLPERPLAGDAEGQHSPFRL